MCGKAATATESSSRWRGRAIAVALVASFMFGAFVHVSFAGHWHDYKNVWHGLVHGSSTTDGSFFGRVDNNSYAATNDCGVGDGFSGWYGFEQTYGSTLCSAWSWRHANSVDECLGAAWAEVRGVWQGHTHYAHNYGQGYYDYITTPGFDGGCPVSQV